MAKIQESIGKQLINWGRRLSKSTVPPVNGTNGVKPEIVPEKRPLSLVDFKQLSEAEKQVLVPFLQRALADRIDKVVREDQRLLQQLQRNIQEFQRKEKLEEEIHQRKIRRMAEIIWFTNRFEALGLLGLLILLLGTGIGINLPPVIGCHSEHTPCWHIRLRENKQILK